MKILNHTLGQSIFSLIHIISFSSRILAPGHHNITVYNLQQTLTKSNQIHVFSLVFIIDANYNVYKLREEKPQRFLLYHFILYRTILFKMKIVQ